VSRHTLTFAVENRLSPLKILRDPALKSQEDGLMIVKECLNCIEKNFRKLNPRDNQPLGFDHYMVDNNVVLVCFTNYIELFIYMCASFKFEFRFTIRINIVTIWNSELRKLQDELFNLKQEHEIEIKKLKMECENQR
jgi:hypothetical protein